MQQLLAYVALPRLPRSTKTIQHAYRTVNLRHAAIQIGYNLVATQSKHSQTQTSDGMAQVVERNIQALLQHRQETERSKSRQDAVADAITCFVGSMRFVYIHLVIVSFWIVANLGWLPLPRFDPSFVILAMAASVEAIFLSTFVLISQNRMAALSDKRADLDLQISLLAEHEITRIISLVSAIADKLGVEGADDPELAELARDVMPEAVLQHMQESERRFGAANTSAREQP